MLTRNINWGVLGATAVMALSGFAPIAAQADQQGQKNLMRNLAIGAGALGVYGLANHNNTLGILGIAGAAVAGSQYEKDRHDQSQESARRHYRYYHRYQHRYYHRADRDYNRYEREARP